MEQDVQKKLDELEAKMNAMYASVEKVRKYFLVIIWITVIAFVVPLIGLAFVVPAFINTYMKAFEGLI